MPYSDYNRPAAEQKNRDSTIGPAVRESAPEGDKHFEAMTCLVYFAEAFAVRIAVVAYSAEAFAVRIAVVSYSDVAFAVRIAVAAYSDVAFAVRIAVVAYSD